MIIDSLERAWDLLEYNEFACYLLLIVAYCIRWSSARYEYVLFTDIHTPRRIKEVSSSDACFCERFVISVKRFVLNHRVLDLKSLFIYFSSFTIFFWGVDFQLHAARLMTTYISRLYNTSFCFIHTRNRTAGDCKIDLSRHADKTTYRQIFTGWLFIDRKKCYRDTCVADLARAGARSAGQLSCWGCRRHDDDNELYCISIISAEVTCLKIW